MRYKKQPGNSSIGYYRDSSFNQRKNNGPLRVLTENDWEQTKYGRAELSKLGEKLLGLKDW